MVQQTLCHADRFTKALSYARADQEPLLRLLLAHTHTTQFNVTPAQKELKILQEFIEQPENTAYAKLWYHLRFLNRLVAGDPAGMDKYAEQGMPLDKALFSIHLGQSKLYQQEKTTAIQLLSNLNGYPIETVLAAEYTDLRVVDLYDGDLDTPPELLGGDILRIHIRVNDCGASLEESSACVQAERWVEGFVDVTAVLDPIDQ
jgi:hypothetical protein